MIYSKKIFQGGIYTSPSEEPNYGTPVSSEEMPRPRKRLPQYDECLRAFLKSGHDYWKVNIDALPSKNRKVVLSSLKWRIKHKREFSRIRVVMSKNEIYLEKAKDDK